MLYPKLQEYLRSLPNPLAVIHEQKRVYWVAHKRFPNLILFKYDIAADFNDPVVCASRGIILDSADDWAVVSYSYDKFFNYGESQAAKIDWDGAEVYEKLDGSLAVLYNYSDEWHVQTSGTPDASGPVNDSMLFSELFWNTFVKLGYQLPLNPNIIVIFELCCKENQIVVQHTKPRLVVHGMRNKNRNFSEINEHLFDKYSGVPAYEKAQKYKIKSLTDCIEAADELNPLCTEGFVVRGCTGGRIKVKSPKYVSLHHLRGKTTTKHLVEVVRAGEAPEVILYWPDVAMRLCETTDKINDYVNYLDALYSSVLAKVGLEANMKTWAMYIKDNPDSAFLFAYRRGKVKSALEFVNKMSVDDLVHKIGG